MRQRKHPISAALRISARMAAGAAVGLCAFGAMLSVADEPVMPKSLDAAISMERADAFPRTAFYYLGYMAYAMHVRTPPFKPSDMLTGEALKRYADVTTKGCWNYAYAAFINAPAGPVLKPGWDQLPAATRFFEEGELARAPVAGPLLVIAGEADESVPFAPLRAVAERACRNGSALIFRSYPGLDHDPTMAKSTPDQLAWVRDRLAGKPSPSNCSSLLK